jgi:hypothetical protein
MFRQQTYDRTPQPPKEVRKSGDRPSRNDPGSHDGDLRGGVTR